MNQGSLRAACIAEAWWSYVWKEVTMPPVPKPSFPPPLHRIPTPAPPSRPPSRPPTPPPSSRPVVHHEPYGIRRAVELLRRLPPGERAVLVDVVKMTLES